MTNAVRSRRVVCLVGSAVVAPQTAAGRGVPGTEGVIALARDAFSADSTQRGVFDREVDAAPNRYQAALGALHRTHGQGTLDRVVRQAVLQAVDCNDDLLIEGALAGDPACCKRLESETDRWHLPPAVRAIGRIASAHPDAMVLTTNFDPLVEVAVARAGGHYVRLAPRWDLDIGAVESSATHVVHLHGHWFRTGTLHMPIQLQASRPELLQSLEALLRERTLVVVGYGGWDDVITSCLASLSAESGARFDVAWAFYETEASAIDRRYPELIERLSAGHERGHVTYYAGVDAHLHLPLVADTLRDSAAAVVAERPTPSPHVHVAAIDTGRLLCDLCSGDPVSALNASAVLRERPWNTDVLTLRTSDVGSYARRLVAAHHAESAAADVMGCIRDGHRAAEEAVECIAPGMQHALESFVVAELESATGHKERARVCVRALGYLGCGAHALQRLVLRPAMFNDADEPSSCFRDHAPDVIDAIQRIFLLEQGSMYRGGARGSARALGAVLSEAVRGNSSASCAWGFAQAVRMRLCGGVQADVLIDDWLSSEIPQIVSVAVDALGTAGFSRAVSRLAQLAAVNQQVKVGVALAEIGTVEALAALDALGDDTGVLFWPERRSSTRLPLVVEGALASARGWGRWAAIRGMGFADMGLPPGRLLAELDARDPLDRGVAALAVARTAGSAQLSNLRTAYAASSDERERVFKALAILHLAPETYPTLEAQLRRDLARLSPYAMYQPLQWDFVHELERCAHPAALALLAKWLVFFRHTYQPMGSSHPLPV